MTVKEAIYQRVREMTEEEAADLLDYLALLSDPDELTEAEMAEVSAAEEEFARGEGITREEFLARFPG
jgi:hypothetical protein